MPKKPSTTAASVVPPRRSHRLTAIREGDHPTRRRPTISRDFHPAVPEEAPLANIIIDENILVEPLLPLVSMSRVEYAATLEKVWRDEPFAGQELLFMNHYCRGRKPSQEFWIELTTLVTFGPKHEGIFFPDSYRMELATDYILAVFRTKGTLEDCCEALVSGNNAFSRQDGYGAVFLNQMGQDYYMASNDLDRETSTVRILNTVHAKGCSARVFLEILRHLLHQSVVADQDPPTLLLGDLFRQSSPKACFREAILVANIIWKLAPRATGCCMPEFQQLTESWGCILSYMAWWYGKCANEDTNVIADLLHDLKSSVVVDDDDDDDSNSHESMLFDIIDTLRPEIIPQVRPKLAERWGLSEVYNLCYK